MAAPLRVRLHRIAETTTARVFGELDLSTRTVLHEALAGVECSPDAPLVLDLAEVEFLDAAGLRAILEATDRLDGGLVVHRGPPHVQRIFSITGLDHEHALAAHRGGVVHPLRFESNSEFVLRLWRAFQADGPAAMCALVPEDVVWQPWHGGGRPLHGTDAFREFWERTPYPPELRVVSCTPSGDDIIVRSEIPLSSGGASSLWSLYEFCGGRLLRALSLQSLGDADVA